MESIHVHNLQPLIISPDSNERPLCTICRDDEDTSEMIYHTGRNSRGELDETIKHCFHASCLTEWHTQSKTHTCPSCREVVTDLTPTMDKAKRVAQGMACLGVAAAMITVPPYLFSEAAAYILGEGIVSSSILWGGIAANTLAPTGFIAYSFYSNSN